MKDWEFWQIVILKNPLWQWGLAVILATLIFFGLRVLQKILVHRLRAFAAKTETDLDDFAVELLNRTRSLFIFSVAVVTASIYLDLPTSVHKTLRAFLVLSTLLQTMFWAAETIDFFVNRRFNRPDAAGVVDPSLATIAPSLKFLGRVVVVILLTLLALDNLGVNVTTLVAGLGVGGIAIALAVQNILGDLFSSLSIILDKPFVIGDTINVGELTGTVEKIGLKTTRLRSVSGEQLIVSNSDLLGSRIKNFRRMQERRILFSLGVVYETPLSKLRMIPKIVQECIEVQRPVRFDRAHFKSYDAYQLTYEIVYFVMDSDLKLAMDIQEKINFEIFDRFEKEGIQFAYPTQTIIRR